LPSCQKLYTLRGVSAVYVTAASIRNSRTYDGIDVARAGLKETGVVCRPSPSELI
jgi:hypothetical protein